MPDLDCDIDESGERDSVNGSIRSIKPLMVHAKPNGRLATSRNSDIKIEIPAHAHSPDTSSMSKESDTHYQPIAAFALL